MSSRFLPHDHTPEVRDCILVVDDTDLIRDFLATLFSPHYAVMMASDGPDALYQATLRSPTVAIVDYEMPGMTGDRVARALSETSPETVLILHSAQIFPPDAPERAPFAFTIQKPAMRIADLERTVELAVEIHRIRMAAPAFRAPA